jgi:hypothetical protein
MAFSFFATSTVLMVVAAFSNAVASPDLNCPSLEQVRSEANGGAELLGGSSQGVCPLA